MKRARHLMRFNIFKNLLLILLLVLPQALHGRGENKLPQTISQDGAWCWFSDPRAIYHEGKYERTYVGSVSSTGDIQVACYDHRDQTISEKIIYPGFQVDDHVNPSLLILPDGRIMAFFTGHNGGLYFTKTKSPEDINKWDEITEMDLGDRLCYTNPVMLSNENNRIYLFSRSGYDWKPSFIYSDDLGETWSDPSSFVSKPGSDASNRPYTKVISDGKSKIWFAITDGHPRDEPLNSVYVFYYQNGKFYNPSESLIGTLKDLPIDQTKIPAAYNANQTFVRAWIWDIALNDNGHPVIAYTRLKEETRHRYFHAEWNGTNWQHSFVAEGGQDFPREKRPKEARNPEPHYSGGIVIDPEQTEVVYYSRPVNNRFEIFRAKKQNKNWVEAPVTQSSKRDNVRPYVVRNSPVAKSSRLLWMSNIYYTHYTNYKARILLQ